MAEFHIGGQAVIEGVMMRGERMWSVAVRGPDGEIVKLKKPVGSLVQRYPALKKPIARGVVAFIETLILGFKALSFSANASAGSEGQEAEAISSKEWAITIGLALAVTVALFMVAPYYLARLASFSGNKVLFASIEGLLRIAIFLVYIAFISQMKDVKRVFQYHGAEHKAINAYEDGADLTSESVSGYSTRHVRCGTSFLLVVMIVAIFIFSFLPTGNFPARIGGKILLLPLVAGVSYEFFKLAARHLDSGIVRLLVWPGLALQRLTTREPDLDQLEVAVVALKEVIHSESPEPAVER